MILSWKSFSTPENKIQVTYFFHIKDWIFPSQTLSDPVFNGAYETLLKFGQDTQATQIFAPSQKSQDSALTQFHTAQIAAKRRIPEHFQSKVELYFFGIYAQDSQRFKGYSTLPKWISLKIIQQNQDFFHMSNPQKSLHETNEILVTEKPLEVNSELVFGFGDSKKSDNISPLATPLKHSGQSRIINLMNSQDSLLNGPLLSWKIKAIENKEAGFKGFEQ